MNKLFIKKIGLLSVFCALNGAWAMADAPDFVLLQSDKAAYQATEKAVLNAYVQTQPENNNYEVFLKGYINNDPFKMTQITDSEWAGVTPELQVGTQVWKVEVYLQDKQEALSINSALAFYHQEICDLEKALETETDPVKRAEMEAIIVRDQELMTELEAYLDSIRILVETKELNLQVNALRSVEPLTPPLIVITPSESDHIFAVGQTPQFTADVMTDFEGEDGPQELVVRGNIDGTAIGGNQTGKRKFVFTGVAFVTGDIGTHTFNAHLSIRSKARSDSLRNGIQKANKRRADTIKLRDKEKDPQKKALYQKEINDLTAIITEFYAKLEAMLTHVHTQSYQFYVSQSGQ